LPEGSPRPVKVNQLRVTLGPKKEEARAKRKKQSTKSGEPEWEGQFRKPKGNR